WAHARAASGGTSPRRAPAAPRGRPVPSRAMTEGHLQPPSFWLAEVGEPLTPRPALERDESVDVAIVGAGFTGLWTAYYLAAEDPFLRVAIVESEIAGFGASGRNGGWCSSHHVGVDAWAAGPKRER